MLFEDAVQGGPVTHINLVEIQAFAGDLLYPLQGLGAGIHQVVRHDNAVASLQQLHAGMAANVSGAAGNQYVHSV